MPTISSMGNFFSQTGVDIFWTITALKVIQKEYIFILNLNIWEKVGKKVYNYDDKHVIPLFDIEDIKHIFKINKLKIKNQICKSLTGLSNKPQLSKKLNLFLNQKKTSQKIKNI